MDELEYNKILKSEEARMKFLNDTWETKERINEVYEVLQKLICEYNFLVGNLEKVVHKYNELIMLKDFEVEEFREKLRNCFRLMVAALEFKGYERLHSTIDISKDEWINKTNKELETKIKKGDLFEVECFFLIACLEKETREKASAEARTYFAGLDIFGESFRSVCKKIAFGMDATNKGYFMQLAEEALTEFKEMIEKLKKVDNAQRFGLLEKLENIKIEEKKPKR